MYIENVLLLERQLCIFDFATGEFGETENLTQEIDVVVLW